jgi:HPt (histidine-containing phosphotransfer) domain-containing protein
MNYKYINTDYIDSVSGGDSEVIREIVALFSEQVVEVHDEMKRLLNEKNYFGLGLLAHKAKSSVAIMGMDDLASLLKTFELQAKEGKEADKYGSYIIRFAHETAEAVRELEDFLKSRTN